MPGADPREELILVLAPTGRDARLIADELTRHGFGTLVCPTLDAVCGEIAAGAGMAVLAEEALPPAGLAGLLAALEGQPSWSDLPLLVLTGKGTPSSGSVRRFAALEPAANLTQLERPVHTRTLLSAARSALRARRRQYDVRGHLAEQEGQAAALRDREDRLQLAVDVANMGVFEVDLLTDAVEVNQRGRDICGWADARTTFARVQTYFHPADKDRVLRQVERAFDPAGPGTFEVEQRIVRADGDVRWVRVRGRAVFAGDGAERRAVRCVGTYLDVTDRKAADESVRASEARFRTLFDSMDQGFCVIEVTFAGGRAADYRFVELNPAFERHSGLSQDLLGKSVREAVPGLEEFWFDTYGRVATTGEPTRFVHHAAPLGRWFEVYAFRLEDTDRYRVAVLFTDVSDRKRAEEELREQDRRKDEFLATLAHELRNPLAPVRTGLRVMKLAPADAPAVAKTRDMMERQLGHMVRLIDDLLDISRVSRGKLDLQKTRVDLRAVVETGVETSRPLVDAGRHALTVDLPPDPIWVDADHTRLAQVVSNVLTNAAKYTPDGGRITLAARQEGAEAVVAVTDTGLGIPADMLAEVFGLFAQVNRTLDRAQGGLGIGLALVRRLMEMHGGTIAAASPGPGLGSTFTVRLPVTTAAPAADDRTGQDRGPVAARRVLVVDDNRDAAESLAMLLGFGGHSARVAHDGPAALETAREFDPQVVFLDIGMPGMNGHEVARRFRGDERLRGAVLVALTGWGGEDDQRRSREAGFDFHLTKPVEPAAVERVLARLPSIGRFRPTGP